MLQTALFSTIPALAATEERFCEVGCRLCVCDRFPALSVSVCQMGLASALKCASEQTANNFWPNSQ